jgi:hypothetical protein
MPQTKTTTFSTPFSGPLMPSKVKKTTTPKHSGKRRHIDLENRGKGVGKVRKFKLEEGSEKKSGVSLHGVKNEDESGSVMKNDSDSYVDDEGSDLEHWV